MGQRLWKVLKSNFENKAFSQKMRIQLDPDPTPHLHPVCQRSSDPLYIVTNYIEWVTTSWTDGNWVVLTK